MNMLLTASAILVVSLLQAFAVTALVLFMLAAS